MKEIGIHNLFVFITEAFFLVKTEQNYCCVTYLQETTIHPSAEDAFEQTDTCPQAGGFPHNCQFFLHPCTDKWMDSPSPRK